MSESTMHLISIYKSPRKEEMYLYVDKRKGLVDVPPALLERFGKPVHLMDMPLRENRVLARTTPKDLMDAIAEKGFFLQMPPPLEDYMKEIRDLAEKARERKESSE